MSGPAVGSIVMFIGYFRRVGVEKTAMVTAVSRNDDGAPRGYQLKFLDDPEPQWVARHTVIDLEGTT
jgi:hypothetical protein